MTQSLPHKNQLMQSRSRLPQSRLSLTRNQLPLLLLLTPLPQPPIPQPLQKSPQSRVPQWNQHQLKSPAQPLLRKSARRNPRKSDHNKTTKLHNLTRRAGSGCVFHSLPTSFLNNQTAAI